MPSNKLLRPKQVADILGISLSTLRRLRPEHRKKGKPKLAYVKFDNATMYRSIDVTRFINESLVK